MSFNYLGAETKMIEQEPPRFTKNAIASILHSSVDVEIQNGLRRLKWKEDRQFERFVQENYDELMMYYTWRNDKEAQPGFIDEIVEHIYELMDKIYSYYVRDDHDFYSLCRQ